jgi:hypothetical protein
MDDVIVLNHPADEPDHNGCRGNANAGLSGALPANSRMVPAEESKNDRWYAEAR